MNRKPVKIASFYGLLTRYDDGTTFQDVEYLPWQDIPVPSPPDPPSPPVPPGPRLLTGFGVDNPLQTEVDRRSEFFPAVAPQEYQSGPIKIQGWRNSWGFAAGPDGLAFSVLPTHDKNQHGMASLVHPALIDGVILKPDDHYVIEWAHILQAPPTKWVNSWQTYALRDSGESGNILASFIKPGDGPEQAIVHFTHLPHKNVRHDSTRLTIDEWPATLRCKVEVHADKNVLKVWYGIDDGAMTLSLNADELPFAVGASAGLGRQGIGVYSPKPYAATVPYYRISVVE